MIGNVRKLLNAQYLGKLKSAGDLLSPGALFSAPILLDKLPPLSAFCVPLSQEDQLLKFKTYCVICKRRIPAKRHRRRAVTCNAAHQKRLTKMRKTERDARKCSHCGKPMTPEQIRLFRLFKASQDAEQAKKNKKAAKGLRGSAKGKHPMAEFAYIAPERHISSSRAKRGNAITAGIRRRA